MSRRGLRLDWQLFVPTLILGVFSLTALFSLDYNLFRNQLLFFVIGIFAFIASSQIDIRLLGRSGKIIYFFAIGTLIIVFLFGPETRGASRWLELFGLRIQFSEIIKPFLVVSLAYFLSAKMYNLKTLAQTVALFFPIFFLIAVQPDLGNAIVYVSVLLLTLFIIGYPLRYFFAIVFGGLLVSPLVWNFLLFEYQKQRIITFFNSSLDPLGTSYNAIQSIIAIGSGMLIGRGFGQGTQSILRFLPERHTDFIFATLAEEIGFIGVIIIFGTFSFLFFRIFRIYQNADEAHVRIFVIGGLLFLLIQFFVNIGMNVGLLPVVGITLPFVSYGGSSLLASFILLGFFSSVSSSKEYKGALEIK